VKKRPDTKGDAVRIETFYESLKQIVYKVADDAGNCIHSCLESGFQLKAI
jgi:hypothetical protein